MNVKVARLALIHALVLGLAADLLLRDGPTGLALPIWVATLGLSTVALLRRADRRVPAETGAWLAAAVLFAAGQAWRDSGFLQVFNFFATVGCIAMAAVSVRDPAWTLFSVRLRDAVLALIREALATAFGIVPVALRARLDEQSTTSSRYGFRAIARAAAISVPILVVFGLLLVSADPIFESFLPVPQFDFETAASHVIMIGFFAWIVGGWARGALDDRPVVPAPNGFGFTLSTLDITMSLGLLNVLFAAYLGAQLAWFFGGATYLAAHTNLTVSGYARRGFFELVWVAVLVVPLLLGTRAVIGDESAIRRRHAMLSLPLIGMLGAIMLSAVLRLRLYVTYFGLTTDRFYPLVFLGWLAVVLLILAGTVLRDRGRLFLAGAILTGLGTLAVLNVANPDVIIARVNINRVATSLSPDAAGLDIVHLATLGGEAVDLAAIAIVTTAKIPPLERCTAARSLLSKWGPGSSRAVEWRERGNWRSWNAGERLGVMAVERHSRDLRAVIHETCGKTPARDDNQGH